jgi:hypothetical protein
MTIHRIVLGAVVAATGVATQAGVYTANLGNVAIPSAAPVTVPFNIPGADTAPIRGFLVGGNWTAVAGGPWSSELGAGLDASTLRYQGGASNGNPFAFPGVSGTYNNSVYGGDLQGVDSVAVSGAHTASFQQEFAGSSAQLANATVSLYTDALSPIASAIVEGPTFNRPSSLTTLSGVGTSVYYNSHPFVAPATGTFLVNLSTPGVSDPDGYLLLYSGSFNPASPLTNLIGVSDDGGNGVGFSSTIPINLTSGSQYVAVATTFDNAITGAYSLYVAGVPEPATALLLLLGGVTALRRR